MMKQYLRIKAEHPDAILFFHLGDFYEAFFEDAEILARELDIVLTARNGHPMAGVPVRRGTAYIAQLLKAGHKVAICQQVEDPKEAKGLVKRAVVRVVTPGTVLDEDVIEPGSNNYLGAVLPDHKRNRFGLAFLDLSTGEFFYTTAESAAELEGELSRRAPSEVLVPADGQTGARWADGLVTTRRPPAEFTTARLDAGALEENELGLRAASAIRAYVEETQKQALAHLRPAAAYRICDQMDLDRFTISSLELVRPLRDGQDRGTLLHTLDATMTSIGRRRLRQAILAPLTDRRAIEAHLDAVEWFVARSLERQELRQAVGRVHDLERLIGRLGSGRMSPHDLLLAITSLEVIPGIGQSLVAEPEGGEAFPEALTRAAAQLADAQVRPLIERLSGMLIEQPPADTRDGGWIRDGYDERLDRFRREAASLRDRLARLEREERERTGIPSLKVGYNRVFGYYLEVTRTHLDKVPADYRRRQTLASSERFITEELQSAQEKIALAEERASALELELFDEALGHLRAAIPLLHQLADALGNLDLYLALAETAHRSGYTRPTFSDRHEIRIRGGRHPVVERIEQFVPNDLDLPEGKDLVILTGPNMAGKSVFLRQIALICLMAQMGSFVPADSALLPIVDRAFARVGASDMLAEGISTFMMEMLEVGAILDRATDRSLIILDEMGRGTSTYDGVSIAWAVAHELASKTRAKTLFATHYQELTRLAGEIPNIVNLHVAVKEVGKEVVFLHRVEPGTAEGSYGVHVARLAGLPGRVTDAADRILEQLLEEAPLSRLQRNEPTAEPLPLFGGEEHPVLKRLRDVDPDRLTPIEALRLLADWKRQLDSRDRTQ